MQKRIFKLLKLNVIFNILVEDDDSLNPNCDLVQIINKENIIEKLRNRVLWHPNTRYELVEIFDEISELNTLSKYLDKHGICTYSWLCEMIPMMPIYIKLEELYQNNQLYPDNFFPLEETGITVEPDMQKLIFKLLGSEQIFDILVKNNSSLNLNCDLVQLINNENIIEKLRDSVIRYHKSGLMKILLQISGLNGSHNYLDSKNIDSYAELCDSIQKMVAKQKLESN